MIISKFFFSVLNHRLQLKKANSDYRVLIIKYLEIVNKNILNFSLSMPAKSSYLLY